MENIMCDEFSCLDYAVNRINKLEDSTGLSQEVSLRAIELMKRILNSDTVYPYIDELDGGDLNILWIGGDMRIVIDVEKDGFFFWDIDGVLPERRYGRNRETPDEMLIESLNKFSYIVAQKNPHWKDLFK